MRSSASSCRAAWRTSLGLPPTRLSRVFASLIPLGIVLCCASCPTIETRYSDAYASCLGEGVFEEFEIVDDEAPTCETWCRMYATGEPEVDNCGSCDGAPYRLHEDRNCKEEPLPLPANAACDDPVPPLPGQAIECCCKYLSG